MQVQTWQMCGCVKCGFPIDDCACPTYGSGFTVINAATGETVLSGVSAAEFDRWYDHHCDWRKPRGLDEVNPTLHGAYIERDDDRVHYLVRD